MGLSYLACLGSWTRTTYSVANGNLLANGTLVAAGILALKAQYGVAATPNSNTVAAWSTPERRLERADQRRARPPAAVRLALVARNAHYERDLVSNACSSTTAASPTGSAPGPAAPAAGADDRPEQRPGLAAPPLPRPRNHHPAQRHSGPPPAAIMT